METSRRRNRRERFDADADGSADGEPDAASLAALSAWAGLNPSDFVDAPFNKGSRPEAIAQISTLLRTDPNLDAQSAEAVEAIVKAAYERLRKADE